MSDWSAFISRDELLGGLPARRASTLLFAIESRTAHLVMQSRQAAARLLTDKTAEARERAFLEAVAQGRDLPAQLTVQDLERYAPEWASLVPPDPGIRAATARMLSEKYLVPYRAAPRLRQALGLDDEEVHRAYQRLHGQPLASIYATQIPWRERLRWTRSRLAHRLESLPPFWTVFALTLTETVGAGILALPIAVAGVGPLAGVVLLLGLGLINLLTIAAVSEAVARHGDVRYGPAYLGRVVADYLGNAGALVLTPALLVYSSTVLLAYYIGIATTLAGATAVPAEAWAAMLFLAGLYFLRRESLGATVASALLIGVINIGLILILAFLALSHVSSANLRHLNVPLVGGRPFDPSVLALVFGVILSAYFGHFSTPTCARLVLQRDSSGRALLWGNAAAMATVVGLYCLWVVAVGGAVTPSDLADESGTALIPLAAAVGPSVYAFGLVFAVLAMGMASIHYSLALFNQVREWLPVRSTAPPPPRDPPPGLVGLTRKMASSRWGRYWLGTAPVLAIFVLIEWLLLTDRESFAAPLGFLGALAMPLLSGVFPVLMLIASRRKGDYVPGAVVRFLGHPVVIVAIYVLFLVGILSHGLFIWQEPVERVAALLTGGVVLVVAVVAIRRGSFWPRTVVELRADWSRGEQTVFTITASGEPANADVWVTDRDGEHHVRAATGELRPVADLRSARFDLPATPSRELKVWAHQITSEGYSEPLPARLEVRSGAETHQLDLSRSRGQVLLPLTGAKCQVQVTLQESAPPSQRRG